MTQKIIPLGWECSSVVDCLPSKTLVQSPTPQKKKKSQHSEGGGRKITSIFLKKKPKVIVTAIILFSGQ
jgi:hypothetical protein